MTELKSLSPEILLHIAKALNVPMKGLVATIELLDEGGTVPFIARYRKEATGNLDEVQIRAIEEQLLYFRELQDRKASVLASIDKLSGGVSLHDGIIDVGAVEITRPHAAARRDAVQHVLDDIKPISLWPNVLVQDALARSTIGDRVTTELMN